MSECETTYDCCAETFADDVTGLVQCISTANDAANADVIGGLDAFFLIFAGALVFFMQVGFAMLLAGSIREKNVANVLLWNLLDSAGGALAFWSIGFALAYGGDTPGGPKTFVGNTGFFLATEGIDLHFWFFQFAFSCAVSSITAGAVAERTKMTAYLFFSFFLVGFVYPVCAHSYWSYNGFLSAFTAEPFMGQGVIDLAGSGPVHMCGGAAALVMCVILGPRMGRFYDSEGNLRDEPKPMGPHSVTLMFLGTFGLWFGWYGFNPGSVLFISTDNQGNVAGLAAVNTTLGAAGGVLAGLITSTIIGARKTGLYEWDTTAAMNGGLTGLAAITAGCASVEPWAGFLIGIIAGWIYLSASKLILKLKIDDAVDAIPVHLFGGAWGVIACGFFSNPARMAASGVPTAHVGVFYGGGGTLLGIQILAVLFVFGWTSVTFVPFCLGLKALNMLRIDELEEEVGMDISRHKGPAYRPEVVDEGAIDNLNQSRHKATGVLATVMTPEPEKPADPEAEFMAIINDSKK
ncbi:hypothetical protein ACHAXA_010216 [Cyclostephanos tholiformis]|uniref:Ammonium transporter n=1 Tax=Cyclostephanos tholiformis TaxID=382380 RepID=A0ABD3SG89_9STRA